MFRANNQQAHREPPPAHGGRLLLRGTLDIGHQLGIKEQRAAAVAVLCALFAIVVVVDLPAASVTLRMGRRLELHQDALRRPFRPPPLPLRRSPPTEKAPRELLASRRGWLRLLVSNQRPGG